MFYILLSPLIWWVSGAFYFAISIGDADGRAGVAVIVGFIGVAAFWAFYFI